MLAEESGGSGPHDSPIAHNFRGVHAAGRHTQDVGIREADRTTSPTRVDAFGAHQLVGSPASSSAG
jgi:hypothetical protein